jgi:hypothetical protein
MVNLEDSRAGAWAEVVAGDARLVADTEWVCFGFAANEAEMSLERVEMVVDLEGCIERVILIEQPSFADMEDLPVKVMPSEVDLGEKYQLFVSEIVRYLGLEMALVGRSSAATGSA